MSVDQLPLFETISVESIDPALIAANAHPIISATEPTEAALSEGHAGPQLETPARPPRPRSPRMTSAAERFASDRDNDPSLAYTMTSEELAALPEADHSSEAYRHAQRTLAIIKAGSLASRARVLADGDPELESTLLAALQRAEAEKRARAAAQARR